MKIIVFDIEPWEKESFKELSDKHQVITKSEQLTEQNVEEFKDADIISVFIYSELKKDVLKKFKNLRFIAARSTGVDHIDIGYCKENKISVSNVPIYSESTVAEYVFALILTISRHMIESIERTRRGNFSITDLRGFDLKDKKIGVIGTGSIGKNVMKIAKGFGMDVLAFDVRPDKETEKRIGFRYVSMEELLSSSDFISIHVPLNNKTNHMISDKEFEKMKNDAVLINTSRGSIVDVEALVKALKDKKLNAVGLDVLPEEPIIREEAELLRSVYKQKHDLENLLADHVLMNLSNVYITPHNAFNTQEAVKRILDTTVENIKAYINGNPVNLVIK